MPYKSDAQRRWAHTKKGEEALGGSEGVNEWDQASKGKKLPEHVKKMNEGGIVEEKGWKDKLKDYMVKNFPPHHDFNSTLEGVSRVMRRQQPNMDEIEALERGPQVSSGTPQGYADGGLVGDSSQEDAFRMSLPQLPQPQQPQIQFNPNAGMPPAPTMPVQPPQRPVLAPNPVNPYLATKKAKLGRFGPEEQLATANHLIQQRQSLPQRGAVALGGLADALMQGVGRTGSPGFMQQIQGQQNKLAEEKMGALEKAGTQNIARTESEMKLDAMDPSSQLSKIAQQTWGPLLSRNGFKGQQIAQMPASAIAALTGQTVEALKAEAEAKMAAATLGLKTQEAAQTAKHQTAQEDIASEESRRQMLKETASHPLLHPINAYQASKQLGEMALNPSSTEAGPYGNETVKDGKTYLWHPDTKKYYLKG